MSTNLSLTAIEQLNKLISACTAVGINSLIIENGIARGADDTKTCLIFSKDNIPELEKPLGLSRLDSLKARLNLFEQTSVKVSATVNSRGEISQLDLSAGRTKAQFRCTSTNLIKAPKSGAVQEIGVVTLKQEEVKQLLDGIRVMGGKAILISATDGKVSFRTSDAANDVFEFGLSTDYDGPNFVSYFATGSLLSAIKICAGASSEVNISISDRGTAALKIFEQMIYFLPQIGDE